jgi:hypothetical protein
MAGLEHRIDPLEYVFKCRDVVHMDNLLVYLKDSTFFVFSGEKTDWLDRLNV